jgi:hypothetical protein
MASAAMVPDQVPPAADPAAIRACLSPALLAEFDHEWDLVLEQAKVSKDLTAVHDLLATWRHVAYREMVDPGAHYRMLAKAEQIMRTGRNPDAVPVDAMHALIRQRQGHA